MWNPSQSASVIEPRCNDGVTVHLKDNHNSGSLRWVVPSVRLTASRQEGQLTVSEQGMRLQAAQREGVCNWIPRPWA